MPENMPENWKSKGYDEFMLREKEMSSQTEGKGSPLDKGLETTKFPDNSIDSSSLRAGPLIGDFRVTDGSIASRDYKRDGTGWSLNSDGTVDGIGGVTPGGLNTQVQFNNNGVFGGNSEFVFTTTGIETSGTSARITAREFTNQNNSYALYISSLQDTAMNLISGGGDSGGFTFTGRDGNSGVGNGAEFIFIAGDAKSASNANGGYFSVSGGNGDGIGNGGYIYLLAGDGDPGGDCILESGDGIGAGNGGIIYLYTSSKGLTGTNNGFVEIDGSGRIIGTTNDDYAAGLKIDPRYTADSAKTLTRHNYFDLQNPSTTNVTITDACVMRFDAAAGTHKAVDSGSTKSTPGTVNAWMKININGTIYYVPAYTSKTT